MLKITFVWLENLPFSLYDLSHSFLDVKNEYTLKFFSSLVILIIWVAATVLALGSCYFGATISTYFISSGFSMSKFDGIQLKDGIIDFINWRIKSFASRDAFILFETQRYAIENSLMLILLINSIDKHYW